MRKKIKVILAAALILTLLLVPMMVFAGERVSLNDDAELIIGDPIEQSSVPSSQPTPLPKPPVPKPKPVSSQPVVSEESESSAVSWDGLPPPSSVESDEWSYILDDEAKDSGNTYRQRSDSRGNDTFMIFLKDNWWWMVGGILVCIIICVVIIIRKKR